MFKNNGHQFFRRYYIIIGILFVVYIFVVIGINYMINQEKKAYFNAQQQAISDAFFTTSENYEAFTYYVYKDIIETSDILALMNQIEGSTEQEVNAIRTEIFQQLNPTYLNLLSSDIQQLHIHLPNGESFLRFHNPSEFGDNLFELRETIRIANQEQRFISGFEEGRTFSGYRYVYPLFYDHIHIGSIEISVSVAPLMQTFYNLYPNRDNFFLLRKDVITDSVFEQYLEYYKPCLISENYLVDTQVNDQFDDSRYNFNKEAYDDFFQYVSNEVSSRLEVKEDFFYTASYQGKNYVLLFHAINNIKGNHVGYIVVIYEDSLVSIYDDQRVISSLFVSGFFFVLIIMMVIYGQDKVKLHELSTKDALTDISNRYNFRKMAKLEIEKARRYKKPLSIIMFDIDFFKHINDTYGHKRGDEVLKKLARLVESKIRITDIFARWGGEEFVLLLPETEVDKALIVAEKLRIKIKDTKIIEEEIITVSFGVATFDESIESVDQFINLSDEALYRAKNSGRNCVKT